MYCRLGNADRGLISRHLLSLSAEDRLFRFGSPLYDCAIERYCAETDWDHSLLIGYVEGDALEGLIQLSPPSVRTPGKREAALTVGAKSRRHGIGTGLAKQCAGHAALAGCHCMVFYWHPENHAFPCFLSALGGVIVRQQPPVGWLMTRSNSGSGRPRYPSTSLSTARVA